MNQKEYKNIRINSDLSNNNENIIKIDKILLEEELRCPICKILYDSNNHIPFVISCGHTFCKQCVFNNSNSKCPIDSIINSFKLYIRNIQVETIINKILISNKEPQNQQKLIYIKPDMKNNIKIFNNNNQDENIIIDKKDIKEKTNRTRGKSINQRAMKKEYKMNSPFSTIKNLNKNLTNKQFQSPNVNILKSEQNFNNIINHNINEKNENKLNFIEDNLKFEEEIDDMLISETIGTIPIYDEKSLTNSIREDFNDLLTKNEIYKKRIINNNINSNNNCVSPAKKKENIDFNQKFFNENNQKIILFEDKDFLEEKPFRLSNYNLRNQPGLNVNRQMTEANPSKDINLYENNSTKTEKKNENKKYKNFYTTSVNKQFYQSNRDNINNQNNNNNRDMNSKNIKTIFDYIKSINKLSSNNTGKNLNKNKDDISENSNSNTKNNNNVINKQGNIINIHNYNNNLRISLEEKHLGTNELNLIKSNFINSPINCQKYIKVRASSKIPKRKNNHINNENIINDDNNMRDNSLNNNKKLKQIKVRKDNNNINNINIFKENTNKSNSNNNSNNTSLLYNKKKAISNKNNISKENLENIETQNDNNDINNLSIKQTLVKIKNNNITSNTNNINITISPNRNIRKLDEDKIYNQKYNFSKTLNQSPLNKVKVSNNDKDIKNIIKVGEYLSKNKIDKSRSLSSYKSGSVSKNNIISKLKNEYESLNFEHLSPNTKKVFNDFFKNYINSNSLNNSSDNISVILIQNNNLFIGILDPDNNSNPKSGILISPNMDYFEGEFVSGKKEGKGKLIYSNGTEYKGNFKNNKPDGYGQLTQENGEVYQGEWKEGKINGHGTRFHKNGDKYIGNYINNVRNGYGIYIFSNGNTYEGNWVKGKADGVGIFKYNNGNIYEGEFKDNIIEGKGKLILKSGEIYKGMFVNGTIHGEGSYINDKGEIYIGEFKNGKKDGKGKLQDKNGNIIQEGFWKLDEFIYN